MSKRRSVVGYRLERVFGGVQLEGWLLLLVLLLVVAGLVGGVLSLMFGGPPL